MAQPLAFVFIFTNRECLFDCDGILYHQNAVLKVFSTMRRKGHDFNDCFFLHLQVILESTSMSIAVHTSPQDGPNGWGWSKTHASTTIRSTLMAIKSNIMTTTTKTISLIWLPTTALHSSSNPNSTSRTGHMLLSLLYYVCNAISLGRGEFQHKYSVLMCCNTV